MGYSFDDYKSHGSLLKAEECDPNGWLCTVKGFDEKTFEDRKTGQSQRKLIMHIVEDERGITLNQTRLAQMQEIFQCADTDACIGRKLVVRKGKGRFGSDIVDVIEFVPVPGDQPAAPTTTTTPTPTTTTTPTATPTTTPTTTPIPTPTTTTTTTATATPTPTATTTPTVASYTSAYVHVA